MESPKLSNFDAVDPGKNEMYVANFYNGCLNYIGVSLPQGTKHDFGNLVIEKMRVYQGSKQKGNPNDLIDVAFSAGVFSKQYMNVLQVEPRVWKGGPVPKKIMLKRIKYVLMSEETNLVERYQTAESERHNLWDAVGIGLWAAGRLK